MWSVEPAAVNMLITAVATANCCWSAVNSKCRLRRDVNTVNRLTVLVLIAFLSSPDKHPLNPLPLPLPLLSPFSPPPNPPCFIAQLLLRYNTLVPLTLLTSPAMALDSSTAFELADVPPSPSPPLLTLTPPLLTPPITAQPKTRYRPCPPLVRKKMLRNTPPRSRRRAEATARKTPPPGARIRGNSAGLQQSRTLHW